MPRTTSRSKKGRGSKSTAVPLTNEKWLTLVPFGSFLITDKDDGKEFKFCKNDITTILPCGREPGSDIELWEYWVGKINDIRAEIDEDGTNSVWAKVQWFYSGKDAADVVKSFDAGAVNRFERIFADHFDFVESEAFDAVISLTRFNENDPEPPFIFRDQFYARYTLEYKARTLKPKPGSAACICQLPYNPNDSLPESVMHFCPRPSCRRAYHQSCLLAGKYKESSSTSTSTSTSNSTIVVNPPQPALRSARKHASPVKKVAKPAAAAVASSSSSNRALRLLACSPDTDDNVDLESLVALTVVQTSQGDDDQVSDAEQPVKKKRRGRPSKKAPAASLTNEVLVKPVRSLADTLADLPPLLLQVAQQPMVRGKAFKQGGVSGNVGFVTRARRLVYQILEGSSLPDDWEFQVFGQHEEVELGADNAIVKIEVSKKTLPLVVCPKCRSAI